MARRSELHKRGFMYTRPPMNREEILQLHGEAQKAFGEGDYQTTLQCYVKLERLQPDEPTWPRGSAVVFKKMGLMPQVVAALSRAARAHADRGEFLKATALAKQILVLDEKHRPTLALLSELHQKSQASAAPKPAPPERPSPGPSPKQAVWVGQSGARLEQLQLREIMPGASQMTRGEASSPEPGAPGVFQIPLQDQPAEDVAVDAVAAMTKAAEADIQKGDLLKGTLPATPLFSDLSEESFGYLVERTKLIELEKDQVLFHQGAPGSALYVVAEGSVGVIDEGPPRRGLAKLEEGAFFGEVALVTNQPRNATIVALEPSQLIEIDLETVRTLVERDQHVLAVLLRFFRDRLVDRFLATNPLFNTLSPTDRGVLKSRFRFLEAEPGAVLIQEGARAEGLLLLLCGHAEVLKQEAHGEKRLGYLAAGDLAGEMSLVTGQPAMATVRAGSKCFAIELPAADFATILKSRPSAREFIQEMVARRTQRIQAMETGSVEVREGKLDLV